LDLEKIAITAKHHHSGRPDGKNMVQSGPSTWGIIGTTCRIFFFDNFYDPNKKFEGFFFFFFLAGGGGGGGGGVVAGLYVYIYLSVYVSLYTYVPDE